MEYSTGLIRKFHLYTETFKLKKEEDNFVDLIQDEKCWETMLSVSPESVILKEHFFSLTLEERERYLFFGIACLSCFVQANFTGPQLPENAQTFLKAEKFQNLSLINRLSMSSEDVNVNTKFPMLLVVAELIFDCCIVNDLVNLWWCCRALMVHQEILDELSPTLLANADRLFKFIKEIQIDESKNQILFKINPKNILSNCYHTKEKYGSEIMLAYLFTVEITTLTTNFQYRCQH